MKKIKILFTGGTIGSLIDGSNINTDKRSQHLLLNLYGKDTSNFTTDAPLNILSENLNPQHWLTMIKAVSQAVKEGYEGVVLTHGSDTLAYSAAFLSYVFYNIKIPVVLVASHKPLSEKDTNGIDNFSAAVELIKQSNKGGVFVAYRNPNEDFVKIHLGSRMQEPVPFSDNFESGSNKLYAVVKDEKITWLNTDVTRTNLKWNYNFKFDSKYVFIRPHPGLDYSLYMNPNNKPNFILHDMFHSGTANTQNINDKNQKTSLLEFSNYCRENGIDLYVCNIKNREVNYDSTNQLVKHNIKPIYDVVASSALAKLIVAYNFLNYYEKNLFLGSNICGEIIHTSFENEYGKTIEKTVSANCAKNDNDCQQLG